MHPIRELQLNRGVYYQSGKVAKQYEEKCENMYHNYPQNLGPPYLYLRIKHAVHTKTNHLQHWESVCHLHFNSNSQMDLLKRQSMAPLRWGGPHRSPTLSQWTMCHVLMADVKLNYFSDESNSQEAASTLLFSLGLTNAWVEGDSLVVTPERMFYLYTMYREQHQSSAFSQPRPLSHSLASDYLNCSETALSFYPTGTQSE